jgi:antitoxin (DNA-binding transcriptional repressor) of toxin-antitoxin stability system
MWGTRKRLLLRVGDTIFCITMKTASVRDLRNNFARISRWLKDGQQVEITSRGMPVGLITPSQQPENGKLLSAQERRKLFRKRFGPEHRKWMKETFGGKVLKGNSVLIMREGAKW